MTEPPRPEGVRLKHYVDGNSVKIYDKHGTVLRAETTRVARIEHWEQLLAAGARRVGEQGCVARLRAAVRQIRIAEGYPE